MNAVESIFDNFNEEILTEEIKKNKVLFKQTRLTEIAIPKGVNGLDKYVDSDGNVRKGCPIHVRASNNYNNLLLEKGVQDKYEKIRNGDKIKYFYLKKNNPINQNIIAFKDTFPEEFEMEKYIDYEVQWEKTFMSPINTLTDAIGWQLNINSTNVLDIFGG
jgi:hypothetical protein